jgi:hypothetical protein
MSLGQVVPSSSCECGGGANCTCGAAGAAPSLVYALGKIDYDFGSEARRDSFMQAMPRGAHDPGNHDHMVKYLEQNPFEAQSLI